MIPDNLKIIMIVILLVAVVGSYIYLLTFTDNVHVIVGTDGWLDG